MAKKETIAINGAKLAKLGDQITMEHMRSILVARTLQVLQVALAIETKNVNAVSSFMGKVSVDFDEYVENIVTYAKEDEIRNLAISFKSVWNSLHPVEKPAPAKKAPVKKAVSKKAPAKKVAPAKKAASAKKVAVKKPVAKKPAKKTK